MCFASATEYLVPRMARTYTDEQIVEAAVAAKLHPLVPTEKVISAQAEAKRLVACAVSLNTAIECACAAAIPVSA